jgi:hypothetical protein
MADKKYNGWTNYETWVVKAIMDNDEATQRYWQEVARDYWQRSEAQTYFSRKENAAFALRDRLKSTADDAASDLIDAAGPHKGVMHLMLGDLLRAAISDVNFYEVARHLIDDVSEGDDA